MLRSPAGRRHRELPRRGTPPATLAARGSHSNAEVEQGKALTADVPEVEALDNLGGDKKRREISDSAGHNVHPTWREHQAACMVPAGPGHLAANSPGNDKPGT